MLNMLSKWRSHGLLNTLLLSVVPVLLIVNVAATAAIGVFHVVEYEGMIRSRLLETAIVRSSLISEALWQMRYEVVCKSLEDLTIDPDIAEVQVVDDTGFVAAKVKSSRAVEAENVVTAPITYKNGIIDTNAGTLRIYFSYDQAWSLFWKQLIFAASVAVLAIFPTIFALNWIGRRQLNIPLGRLLAGIESFSRDGGAVPVHVDTSNELSVVASAFNKMQFAIANTNAQLVHLAMHDPLTGLPNRRGLEHYLNKNLVNSASGDLISGYFLDMDKFKYINDTYGHHNGDVVLQTISRRIKLALPENIFIARMGGDEFIAIQLNVECKKAALETAKLIGRAVTQPIQIDQSLIVVSMSIGVACRSRSNIGAENLLRLADIALYEGKAKGGGCVTYISPDIENRYLEQRALEEDLDRALECGEFHVHYQIQYQFDCNGIHGAEALARWKRFGSEAISPIVFLPLLESSGNMWRFTKCIIAQVCRDASQIQGIVSKDFRISINVSTSDLTQPDFVAYLTEVCASAGLRPSTLEIEITEQAAIADLESARSVLKTLRDSGFYIALDDFGVGFSSLSHLTQLPIHILKLDKSFIENLPGSKKMGAVVRSIKDLATIYDIDIVAEGIETGEQYEFLGKIGVQFGQGYLMHRPEPLLGIMARIAAARAEPLKHLAAKTRQPPSAAA